jgi:LmbE family N-acetylglucosaminyl deacetylase
VRVLAIGAHPDDIELGCGATLLAHRAAGDTITLLVMTTGEQGPQDAQSRVSEQEEAAAFLGASLLWGGFEDGLVPDGHRAIRAIEKAAAAAQPDVVYTHAPRDTHQDHRATAAATLAAARRAPRILCYESPTSIEFVSGFYVDVAGLVEAKLDLIRCHMSQVLKNGLVDLEAVEAQARFRGFTGRVRQAESFEPARFTWAISPHQSPEGAMSNHRSTFVDEPETLPEVQYK